MPYGDYGGYGLGGNGGVGGSIARGLQSGFEMGRQVDADKAAKEQRAFENERQTAQDARAQQVSDINAAHQGYLASNELIAGHKARGAALVAQYGNNPAQIPQDVQDQYAQEGQGYLDTRKAHLQKLASFAATGKQQAQDDATNMQVGKLDPLDPKYPADRLVHTFTATTGRPVTDLMSGPNGEPALVLRAADDFQNGVKTGNEGLTLKAANTLFSRELQTGVGQPSPHGGTIVGKQIVKILPAPPGAAPQDPNAPQQDPNAGKVTPIVRVFVREGPSDSSADYGHEGRNVQGEEQTKYGAPPGATGHYDAPVTQNRSTDPNDPIAHISMEDAMNRIEQLRTAATSIAGNPELKAKLEKGIETGAPDHNAFLNAYRTVGGTMPGATHEDITKPTLRVNYDAQGNPTGQQSFTPPEAAGAEAKPPAVHNVIQGSNEQSMQWNSKTKQYEPIGAAGPRFKPAPEEGTKGALAQKLAQINNSDLSDEDKVQAKRTALMGAGAAGLGSREAVFTNRILISANEATKDLANIARLPIKSDTGFFGGRKQGPSLFDAGKEALTQAMTSQEVQSYNTRSAGLQRSMASIEAAGLAPSGTLSHQMEAVQFRAGDSQQTRLEKLAQTRQIVDAGLETTLANPKLGDEQRKHVAAVLDSLHKAIPFTIEDVDKLGTLQDANPKATLNDVMKMHKLNKPQAPSAPPSGMAEGAGMKRIASDADYDALPSGSVFLAPDGTQRRKP